MRRFPWPSRHRWPSDRSKSRRRRFSSTPRLTRAKSLPTPTARERRVDFSPWMLSTIPRLPEIAQAAAENLYAFGSLDVLCELIFIFAWIQHVLGFRWPFQIQRLHLRPDKMRSIRSESALNPLAKFCDVLYRVGACDAAASCHFFELHFPTARGAHPGFSFMTPEIISIVHHQDGEIGGILVGNHPEDSQIQDQITVGVERKNFAPRQRHRKSERRGSAHPEGGMIQRRFAIGELSPKIAVVA